MKRLAIPISFSRLFGAVIVMGAFGVVGLHQLYPSFAATAAYNHDPRTEADYCALEGVNTVLYGWGFDPDAPAGANPYIDVTVAGVTTRVASSIANYRDAAINNYIKNVNPGAPTSSIYGWRLSLGTLYKGGSYPVSGSGVNYGAGVGIGMGVNTTSHADIMANKTIFNSNRTIPDACLTSKPVTTPPPTTPPPTTGGGGSKGGGGKSTTPTTPAAVAAPTSDANGTVAVGTTSAVVKIPAGNAAKIHLTYKPGDGIEVNSSDQDVTGDSASITLTDLEAATTYSYSITRINSAGSAAASPPAPFTTSGYSVSLHFTNNAAKDLVGLSGTINDASNTKAKSDDKGIMTFSGLPDGAYAITFTYNGKLQTRQVDTSSDTSGQTNADGSPALRTLTDTINVDKLSKSAGTATASKSSNVGIIIVFVLLIPLLGFGAWFLWHRRRQRRLLEEYSGLGAPLAAPTPLPLPAAPYTDDSRHNPAPLPTHAGESLRDMVIESMRERAVQNPEPAPEQFDVPTGAYTPLPPVESTPQPAEPYVPPVLPPPEPQAPAEPQPAHHAVHHKKHTADDDQSITIDHTK